jgi:hypothetical protein
MEGGRGHVGVGEGGDRSSHRSAQLLHRQGAVSKVRLVVQDLSVTDAASGSFSDGISISCVSGTVSPRAPLPEEMAYAAPISVHGEGWKILSTENDGAGRTKST